MTQDEAGAAAPIDRRAIPADAKESSWLAPDRHAIRRLDGPAIGSQRGSILFLPGRGDCYEKYLEAIGHWRRRGWGVTAADWRGQGGSGRLGLDAAVGHIDDFAAWIGDLGALWGEWKAATPSPHVLVGHSMGGHLVLRAAAEARVDPVALVLSAPMLGLVAGKVPLSVLHTATRGLAALGDRRRAAWKSTERPGGSPLDRIALLTHCEERYADELWWRQKRPEIALGPPSWGWVEAAMASMRRLERPGVLEGVRVPVLALATTADRLVDFGAIERAVRRLPKGELVRFGAEARHEILRETEAVRENALSVIDAFLKRAVAPVSAV